MNDKNDNIEEKIKDVIKNKLTENLDDTTMDLINKLYEIFPNLKDGSDTKNNLINKTDSDNNEIVLEEITYNNTTYYKDKHNGVWDSNAELVGIINKEQIYMFQ